MASASGPSPERHIRTDYFTRIAEQAETGEDVGKLRDRQRKAFNRAVKSALDAKYLIAADRNGERKLWLP